jgi:hypothetical protein
MRIIATIENEPITEHDDGSVTFRAKAAIDSDGIGPHHGDKTAQNETSLKVNGQYLNADEDCYIVVPPAIINGVKGIVLGCQAHVTNSKTGAYTDAVVGDIGPHNKLGEISCATASAIGLNPSPVSGGVDAHIIDYVLHPGDPAVVGLRKYTLQPSGAK